MFIFDSGVIPQGHVISAEVSHVGTGIQVPLVQWCGFHNNDLQI
jgi:hypothetical protein